MRRIILKMMLVAALLAGTSVPAGAAQAELSKVETHCTIEIVGQLESGEYVTNGMDCYASAEEAQLSLAAATLQPSGGLVTLGSGAASGTHFDGLNYSGSSLTVWGGACGGGWLNLPSNWINRVESTISGCNRVKHHDGYNQTGSYQSTWGSGNLSTLRNRANSISYWT